MPNKPVLLSVNNYNYVRGGAETVFLEHNRMFREMGWSVVPFSMKHPRNEATEWDGYFVDEIEFGQEYSLPQKLVRLPKVVYSFEARKKLARLLDDYRPDICHAHNIYHHISPSILGVLRKRGIPTVLTLHDLKIACPAYNMLAADGICERCKGGRVFNVLRHRCIKGSVSLSAVVMLEAIVHRLLGSYRNCVDKFVVPSRFYIEKLVEWGMPRQHFAHVPNFVRTDQLHPVFGAGRRVLFFGRLSREKGVATLIRAGAAAGVPLSIAGTGPQLEELRGLAYQLKADVSFLGYLGGKSLQDAIGSARAVVLPSEWYENAPMSVLEAYAMGKPVLGANIGGIPELVLEQQTGRLFASGSVDSLAGALTDVCAQSDEDIERMGRNGHEWVMREFSTAAYKTRILEIYRNLGISPETISKHRLDLEGK